MLELVNMQGVDLLTDAALERRGVTVAFTGKKGGLGEGRFSELNLSFSVGDKRARVIENRLLVARAIGVPIDRWVACRQVHGASLRVVGPLQVGRGARDFESGIPRADALVTGMREVAICVLTADCLPLVMAAPGRSSVAVAHAGWRGLLAGVAGSALLKTAGIAGCGAEDVDVYIGPHIRQCCMEAGEEVAGEFSARFGDGIVKREGGGKAFIDLEGACARQLVESGAAASRLTGAGACTACSEDYFSFRSSRGECGRQAAFAVIRDTDGGF